MKILSKTQALVLTALANMIVFAQDKAPDLKVDVNTHGDSPISGGGDWMSNPLIWVIGALVVILLVALVARGGGNK